MKAEQTVTITFEVAADDAGDRDALVAGYLALRRPSTGLDDIMGAFFGQLKPASVSIVKTEPGAWRITSAEAKPASTVPDHLPDNDESRGHGSVR